MEDGDDVPLIREPRRTERQEPAPSLNVDGSEDALQSPGLFVWILALSAGISGLLFGYDTGVISATLVSIGSDLSYRPLTTWDKSLITSCTSLFALLASPLAGVLADRFGRRGLILVADVLFAAGALWQAYTGAVWGMIGGRSIVGMAIGAASLVVPLYISEISPAPFRGRLVTLSCLSITVGQVVAYVVGYLFSGRLHGWRWMVGVGALPACFQFVTLLFLPESPRWLVQKGRVDKAKLLLYRIYGNHADHQTMANKVLRAIEREIDEEDGHWKVPVRARAQGSFLCRPDICGDMSLWRDLFYVRSNRRALSIACLLQGLQQLCGFNCLMYYSATIFALVGFQSPVLTSLSIALTNCVFTLVAFRYIDRVGRRKMLLYSIPVMMLALAVAALAAWFVPSLAQRAGASATNDPHGREIGLWPVTILLALMVYVAAYAVGLGNVPWQQSELFALPVRAIGSGLATATNWAGNFSVALVSLAVVEQFSLSFAFLAFFGFLLVGFILIYRQYIETAGLSLEQITAVFANIDNETPPSRSRHDPLGARNAENRPFAQSENEPARDNDEADRCG